MEWNETTDVVVVGGGAGGLVSAITARVKGLKTILVEKSDVIGGSSALSGGGLWIPNNHVSKAAGLKDSPEEALLYLDTVIEHQGKSSSKERKEAFVFNGSKMVKDLEDLGIKWRDGIKYPDYYPDKPGGKIGRSIECQTFNVKELGENAKLLRDPGMKMPFPIHSGNVAPIARTFTNLKDFSEVLKMMGQGAKLKLKGEEGVTIGQALIGRLLQLALDLGVDIRVSTPIQDLIFEENTLTGIEVEKDGESYTIGCKAAIMASGGFDHNMELRKKYHGITEDWSSGSPDNTGDLVYIAEKHGLDMELMDDAWWGPSLMGMDGKPTFMVTERALPHSIIVDGTGERYFNESESYVDAGHAMLARQEETGNAIPSWIIMDSHYRNRYLFGQVMPRLTPKELLESGYMIKGQTLAELADKCGFDGQTFRKTVDRFNRFASIGIDEDFGRGNTDYDRYYGDPAYKNPGLGTINKGPYYAVRVYPGDLGTKGGLLANEHSEVLKDGKPIKGLYATGNCSASVMGRTYPGPGSTLGPATVFGYIAANHASATLFNNVSETVES